MEGEEMKTIGMCCVLNEDEFIEDFFRLNLPLVDKMVIAEGAVVGFPFSTKNGHSIDNTNTILDLYKSRYPNKIEIIRKEGKWKSKQEQQNSMLKYVDDGDWCWIFGSDEFYMPDTKKKLIKIRRDLPHLREITFPTVHFFGDTNHMIVDNTFGSPKIIRREQRFFKYETGLFYLNHPTINNSFNQDIFFSEYYADYKLNLGMERRFSRYEYRSDLMGIWHYNNDNTVYRFHYGFVRDILAKVRKHIYYLMRDRGMMFKDAIEFLMDKTNNDPKVIYGYIEQIHQDGSIEVGEYEGEHPLMNKKFKNSEVDFNKILKNIGNFSENPKK